MSQNVKLNWINNHNPADNVTAAWGVAWPRGEMKSVDSLRLLDGSKNVEMDSWVNAWWPDGSIKWTGHSAVISGKKNYTIDDSYGIRKTDSGKLEVCEKDDAFIISNKLLDITVPKSGDKIIGSICKNGKVISNGSALEFIVENRDGLVTTHTMANGITDKVTIEQCSNVRCVVKIEGKHAREGKEAVADFIVRLYIYKGVPKIEISYTMIYTGDCQEDYVKGIGIKTDIPMEGELYNRHIRMGGDTGFYVDGPINLASTRTPPAYRHLQNEFYAGRYVTLDRKADERYFDFIVDDLAVWGNYKLVQNASNSYTMYKRTKNEKCSWIKILRGNHSNGTAYAGGLNGGVGVSIRDFWQKYPSGLELKDVDKDTASVYAWFYSPDCEAMDLRHYDTTWHMNSSYEGFEEFRATPYGIANTEKAELWFYDVTPTFEELDIQASEAKAKPRLICPPEQMYAAKVFGPWSLEDRSTPAKKKLEELNDMCLDWYVSQRDECDWYGFWDYGDIMRMYDQNRHAWRFDVGGCAWNNTEITPNLWMWFAFIRSGREDLFNIAEAYTRHSSEVDQYHKGQYAMLGSRHNVSHWGCGCKEARISMAFYNKFYFYITTDERTGDIMDEVKDADFATLNLPPLRARDFKSDMPMFLRSGPDWSAFMSNWFVQWERYKDEKYRDKMLVGINDIKEMKYRLNSGPTMGYDPQTGHLKYMGIGVDSFHMINFFGALEAWLEIAEAFDCEDWSEMYAEYGKYAFITPEEKMEMYPDEDHTNRGFYYGKSPAAGTATMYYALRHNEPELIKRVWDAIINRNKEDGIRALDHEQQTYSELDVAYPVAVPLYNSADAGFARLFIDMFFALELGKDYIPEDEI